jgi:hypothetical protein
LVGLAKNEKKQQKQHFNSLAILLLIHPSLVKSSSSLAKNDEQALLAKPLPTIPPANPARPSSSRVSRKQRPPLPRRPLFFPHKQEPCVTIMSSKQVMG